MATNAQVSGAAGVQAINVTDEQIVTGEATVITINPNDPMIARLLNASFEAHDAMMGLGQRVLSLEAEINALRGDLAAYAMRRPLPSQRRGIVRRIVDVFVGS